jgi:murein DD-endopeptidase MepM/ murein hydrolase activator NlpD
VTPAAAPSPPSTLDNPLPAAHLSSGFGARRDPRDGTASRHAGVDLVAPRGTAVHAPAAGRVRLVADDYGEDGRYGRTVVIDHGGGLETQYSHLDAALVRPGQEVAVGEVIGRVGASGWVTGPHLHLEVHRDGEPVDPASYIPELETPGR